MKSEDQRRDSLHALSGSLTVRQIIQIEEVIRLTNRWKIVLMWQDAECLESVDDAVAMTLEDLAQEFEAMRDPKYDRLELRHSAK